MYLNGLLHRYIYDSVRMINACSVINKSQVGVRLCLKKNFSFSTKKSAFNDDGFISRGQSLLQE